MTTKTNESIHSLTAKGEREQLAEMKQQLRQGYSRTLELAIEAKEAHIARLDRDHARVIERQKQREKDEAARIQKARSDLERKLMDDYRAASPGTTDAEAKAALPDLLHRHRLAELDRDAEYRAEVRRRVRPI